MEIIYRIFGVGKDLSATQMCSRAVAVYFIALVLIRISGRRTFGKRSAFDNTLAIILGAILSRAVVGASPFVPTVACSLALVILHRALAWLAIKSEWVSRLIKGEKIPLFKNGEIHRNNLARSLMNEDDLMSDLRLKGSTNSLNEIEEINMEASGEVSLMKKKH
jgi:uncharacterized membrane protein YcaP (DUF421 family)